MSVSDPLVYGVPCFIAFIILELAYSRAHGDEENYHWKDLFASGFMGVGSAILGAFLKVAFSIVMFEAVYAYFNPLSPDGVRINLMGYESFGYAWYVWPLCFLADDFTYYWFHRANHEVRVLWAAHIVHHSSEHFNLGTAIRNGWFTLLYKPLFYAWMPAIGFPPEMVLFCLGLEALWQFQLHTVYLPRLGILEKWVNTHSMHQVHHARNLEYLDKNHGGFFNFFDKMFGTWKAYDDSIEIDYGVIHSPDSYNPMVILTHEYRSIWQDLRSARSLREGLMYLFGPPGWSPDKSTLTVKEQQQILQQQSLERKPAG
ncbi:sterol desaturase family protein [Robiginitalea sediminis]|uniref:sterol desaturase family protein n=1 Tax=Robiginitalea sediminis TaxID=1982593 RepID=UPI000B4B00C5|nr:sterol desaturase family protein [Robiginitalea sediminis]